MYLPTLPACEMNPHQKLKALREIAIYVEDILASVDPSLQRLRMINGYMEGVTSSPLRIASLLNCGGSNLSKWRNQEFSWVLRQIEADSTPKSAEHATICTTTKELCTKALEECGKLRGESVANAELTSIQARFIRVRIAASHMAEHAENRPE